MKAATRRGSNISGEMWFQLAPTNGRTAKEGTAGDDMTRGETKLQISWGVNMGLCVQNMPTIMPLIVGSIRVSKEVMHMGGASIANPADYMANNDHEVLVVLDLKRRRVEEESSGQT